jgi:hypothetical protein
MFKKYLVDIDSIFHKSLVLSIHEKGNFAFHIEGLSDSDYKDLFPYNSKIKFIKNEIDIKSFPYRCEVVYLDENNVLKALLLSSKSGTHYLFRVDHQKEHQLNIHQKYISKDKKSLLEDYEKHSKVKGKNLYDGEGDFDKIKDLDYFENRYKKDVKKQNDKESSLYRLIFHSNNMFTTDFVDLVDKKKIKIINKDRVDKNALTLSSMQNNKHDRKDCLFIDSETKDIKYFIFTYKPGFIKHFLLFKNLGNDTFEFIKETICFNELLMSEETKDLRYKHGSEFASKSFAKNRYENFYNEYIAFEEEEEFDEEVQNELENVIDLAKIKKEALLKEVMEIVKENKLPLDIGVTYHGKERIIERIGEMNEKEMLSLAKIAYEKGLTSGHFIEKDATMFKFLQYHQNKKRGKILKIYSDILFFYSLEPPHMLVTCFPYQNNYEKFVNKE